MQQLNIGNSDQNVKAQSNTCDVMQTNNFLSDNMQWQAPLSCGKTEQNSVSSSVYSSGKSSSLPSPTNQSEVSLVTLLNLSSEGLPLSSGSCCDGAKSLRNMLINPLPLASHLQTAVDQQYLANNLAVATLQHLQQTTPSNVVTTSKYKTELCRQYSSSGSCKYGEKCQFAHGKSELRDTLRHPKYKTELCRKFYSTGFCNYGSRCHFLHDQTAFSFKSESENFMCEDTSAIALSKKRHHSYHFDAGQNNYLANCNTTYPKSSPPPGFCQTTASSFHSIGEQSSEKSYNHDFNTFCSGFKKPTNVGVIGSRRLSVFRSLSSSE